MTSVLHPVCIAGFSHILIIIVLPDTAQVSLRGTQKYHLVESRLEGRRRALLALWQGTKVGYMVDIGRRR